MVNKNESLISFNEETCTLYFLGKWDFENISEKIIDEIYKYENIKNIDGSKISKLDTIGAYFVNKVQLKLNCKIENITESNNNILELVANNYSPQNKKDIDHSHFAKIYKIGKNTTEYITETKNLIAFMGNVFLSFLSILERAFTAKWKFLVEVIYHTGVKAIGIISLLCFLIGIVMCYQAGMQLKTYGANIFVVDLLGISLLREFAPLITAIIVAGRSASAFTAEIGAMKVQEEIDALQTFGIDPIQRLVLPRILGIIIALPFLVVIADIISVLGGMVMASIYLDISPYEFMQRFEIAVSFKNFMLGLIKAPFFALIIGCVGCYRGLSVKNNSLSIGQETTKSVVYSIFLVIIVDALFSIIFSSFGV